MKYVVTDDFVAAHGWTPDKTAKALMEPLARVAYWSNELAVLASEALDRSTDATRRLKGKNLAGLFPTFRSGWHRRHPLAAPATPLGISRDTLQPAATVPTLRQREPDYWSAAPKEHLAGNPRVMKAGGDDR